MGSPEVAPHEKEAARPARRAGSDKVKGFLDMLPLVGKPCAWVYEHWGLTGLLSFVFGLVLSIGLVRFGAIPGSLVSEKYKGGDKPTTPKTSLTGVEVTPMKEPMPGWLQPYSDWLDEVAEGKRGGATRAGVGAVTSGPLPRTEKFRWVLKAAHGFDLNGRAFRLRRDGYYKVFEPVKEQGSVYFEVPECDEGDRLMAVLIATWQGGQPQVEIIDTFRSTVVAGER